MATLKDVKTKITAVKKTKQITKAMNMVATSRLRGAQMAMEAFRPYAGKFAEVLGSLADKAGDQTSSPLLIPRTHVENVHIILCTSDRGLCGGFNTNLITKAEKFLKENANEDVDFSFTNFGKRGRNWCRKNKHDRVDEYIGVMERSLTFGVAAKAGQKMINTFLAKEYDEVYVVFSKFESMSRQVPTIKQLLPIPPIVTEAEEKEDQDSSYLPEHICEPSPDALLNDMLPRNVFVQLYNALLETSTSEHAARMMAMENATNACDDMIEDLTLVYNKARQAAITADLMDIVCGAEALKG